MVLVVVVGMVVDATTVTAGDDPSEVVVHAAKVTARIVTALTS